MKLDEASELKDEILTEYYTKTLEADPGIRTQSLEPEPRAERRMAVGLSRVDDDYTVELRIQRENGVAHSRAAELKEKYGDAVNLMILHRLEVPSLSARSQGASSRPGRYTRGRRPLHIGLSVGHGDGPPGTLGAFVNIKGREGILSNSHVLSPTKDCDANDPVYQPGREVDVKQIVSTHKIGELGAVAQISKRGANYIDAAVATLDEKVDHEGNRIPIDNRYKLSGRELRRVASPLDFSRGTELGKVGRSTGLTTATLNAPLLDDATVYVPNLGNVRFDNVLEILWESPDKPFSDLGDSGSLVFTINELRPIGLVFAGGVLKNRDTGQEFGVSYACSLMNILDTLDIKMLT